MIFYHKQRKQFIIIANYFTFTNYVNEIDTRLLDYSRLISNCAFAGGPFPIELVPTQPYNPSSCRLTDPILRAVDGQSSHASPCRSFPLNCHLWAVVAGLPIVLQ